MPTPRLAKPQSYDSEMFQRRGSSENTRALAVRRMQLAAHFAFQPRQQHWERTQLPLQGIEHVSQSFEGDHTE